MEPPAKRRRRAHRSDDDDDELASEPLQLAARRDPGFRLRLERAYADHRFQTTMAHIFDKYGRSFDGIGDEIDLATGEIVVNNGHLQNMRHEADVGIPPPRHSQEEPVPEEEEEEEDRIMHGRELDRDPLDSSGPVAGPGRSHLQNAMVSFPSRPHHGHPRHRSSSSRASYLASSPACFAHSPLAFASSPLALGPWALQPPSLGSSLAQSPSQLLPPAPGPEAPSRLSIWAPGYRFREDEPDPAPPSALRFGSTNPWAQAKRRLMKFILPAGMRTSRSDDDLDEDAILAGRSFRSPTGARTRKNKTNDAADDDDILTSGLAPPRTASPQQGLQLVRWRPARPARSPHSGRMRTISHRVQKQLPSSPRSDARFRSAQKPLPPSPSAASSSTALVRQGPRPASDGENSDQNWRRTQQRLVVEVPSEPPLGRQAYELIEAPVEEVADSADDEMETGSLIRVPDAATGPSLPTPPLAQADSHGRPPEPAPSSAGQTPAATVPRPHDRPRAARRSLPALAPARMAPQSAPSLSDDEMPVPCGGGPRPRDKDRRPASPRKPPKEGGGLEAAETTTSSASASKTGRSRFRKEVAWLRRRAPPDQPVASAVPAVRPSPGQAPQAGSTDLSPSSRQEAPVEEDTRGSKCRQVEKGATETPPTGRCRQEKDETADRDGHPSAGPQQDKSSLRLGARSSPLGAPGPTHKGPGTKLKRRERTTASPRSLLSLLAPDDGSSDSSADELARRSAPSTGPPLPAARPRRKPWKVLARTTTSCPSPADVVPCGRDGTHCGRDYCFTCL